MIDAELLGGLLAPSPERGRFYGVVVAIVTNADDAEGLGRVKLSFPWLSDTIESDWVRVLTPMAGPRSGVQFLPRQNDEVLVAFEHGVVDRPYVLGGLWSKKDQPPEPYEQDKNQRCTIVSRSGHTIRLDDNGDQERLEIIGKGGKHYITINIASNSIIIAANEDDAAITISANGPLTLEGKKVSIAASEGLEIAAGKDLEVKSSGGNVTLKGTFIDLNP